MNRKFRLQDIETDGYYFTDHPCLYWHSGEFWFNETQLKKVYNNGSLSVLLHQSKLSIKKLRKQARKCRIKLLKETLPF